MKNPAAILILIASLTIGVAQAESAFTVRATDLQAQAQSDSAVIASLPENAKVEVLRRMGAWNEVKTTAGKAGWVRMLSLRFDPKGASQGSGAAGSLNALSGLLSTGRTSNTATVTTGVRGLTEEDLKNAQANPAELGKMHKYAADKTVARNFAQRNKLTVNKVEYLQASAASDAPTGAQPSMPMLSPDMQN